ncbi:MAG: CDC48 family AAA ATPase [Candidatus Woesearchaeota archaeon]
MVAEIKLKVAEALQDDVNKGIVRIDSSILHELGIRQGDFVQITGNRTTVAIVERAYPGDIGLNIVRMDGLIRKNAKTTIGDFVTISPVEVKEAETVVLGPATNDFSSQYPASLLKSGLVGKAVLKGDLVGLGGTRRRRITFSDSNIDDFFGAITQDFAFGLGGLKFVVLKTNPSGPVVITENTQVIYNPDETIEEEKVGVSYEDIGGLQEEVRKVREMIELPLKHPEIFKRLGIEPPKGILLYGPPGTGKTLLARAVANETNASFFVINGPEIMSKYYGQSEANLRKIFEDAEKNAPSIIFIDEIDAIAPKREDVKGEVERRVVAQLLTLMDGLKSRGRVIVIAATNLINEVDPALRRPGRFDREIEISVPNLEGRVEILKIHTRDMPLQGEITEVDITKIISEDSLQEDEKEKILSMNFESKLEYIKKNHPQFFEKLKNLGNDKLLEKVAEVTYGYVGADLAALCKEAAMIRLRRVLPDLEKLKDDENISEQVLEKLQVSLDDFYEALKVVKPSAMREVLIEIPRITWNDVGGLDEVKQQLKEVVEWPLKHPEIFARLGVDAPRGVLLYGPPGTGKTLLAKAIANEAKANFISIKGPELLSKWLGESERAIRKIFAKARQTSPSIVFIDEIDSIAPRRGSGIHSSVESVVNQLLTEIDGMQELRGVIVMAATNRPDIVDPALLRPGRFDRLIYVPQPDYKTRLSILKVHTKTVPLKDVDLEELARLTENYSGADLATLVKEAVVCALREDMNTSVITMAHFKKALETVKPSLTKEIINYFEKLKDILREKSSQVVESPVYYG